MKIFFKLDEFHLFVHLKQFYYNYLITQQIEFIWFIQLLYSKNRVQNAKPDIENTLILKRLNISQNKLQNRKMVFLISQS
ncbi:unnamed protein product [Paramecium sonneborni]|uniref:Uncharacterized protein n=1 Tax=Paramecium sonneborni TaxID=65129 RepID=A0A8S1RNB9_9CILI|nr:unnamed protein product [Paramecium sonneborni]